jgi:hypothetical protein
MSGAVPHIESSHDLFSAETAQSFAPLFDDLWAACELQGIPISGYGHEASIGQYEVNFKPGEPLAQADAVFRFKRLVREIARRHGCLATFMAKPYLTEPGTGMHWHVSLSDSDGRNAFSAGDDSAHPRLEYFIGGWQASAQGPWRCWRLMRIPTCALHGLMRPLPTRIGAMTTAPWRFGFLLLTRPTAAWSTVCRAGTPAPI